MEHMLDATAAAAVITGDASEGALNVLPFLSVSTFQCLMSDDCKLLCC